MTGQQRKKRGVASTPLGAVSQLLQSPCLTAMQARIHRSHGYSTSLEIVMPQIGTDWYSVICLDDPVRVWRSL